VRNAEQALQQLLQRGSVGDEVWERFLRGKEEVEAGCRDVVQEVSYVIPLEGCFENGANGWVIGKCVLRKLGPNDLPVRERNGE
jgi:Preprotein translocase subunit Sec66